MAFNAFGPRVGQQQPPPPGTQPPSTSSSSSLPSFPRTPTSSNTPSTSSSSSIPSTSSSQPPPPLPADALRSLDAIRSGLSSSADARVRNDLLLQLIELAKNYPHISTQAIQQLPALFKSLRFQFVDRDHGIRNQSLRAMRYLLNDENSVKLFQTCNMDLLVVRSLERDSGKYLWERMQALKLIRRVMVVAPSLVSRTMVQSLVSIAEHPKDDFRRVCLDAIRELVLLNPDIVASCNGIRTIVDSILDPTCQDIAGSLTLTLLYLLDQDATRRYLRPSLDIIKLLSVFTDTSCPDSPEKEAKRAAAHRALVTIMRSWTGILCLTSDPQGLTSLVELLGLPPSVKGASWAREAVFDLLFEIMHVVKSADLHGARSKNVWSMTGPNLLHNYIVMVLMALMNCGLIEILTKLGMSGDKDFSGVATNLLTEILRLSSDLLPRSVCAKLNALPAVVAQAANFSSDVSTRVRALNMLTGLSNANWDGSDTYSTDAQTQPITNLPNLPNSQSDATLTRGGTSSRRDSVDYDRSRSFDASGGGSTNGSRRRPDVVHGIRMDALAFKTDVQPNYERFSEIYDSGSRSKARIVQFMRHHMDTHIDDTELQNLLKKSQVLSTKDYKLWDFDLCLQLLEGPLTTPTALQSALKTKFIKRLLSFMRPDKRQFCDLDWSVPNMRYVRVACQLVRTLLSSAEGREYPFFTEFCDGVFSTLLLELGKDPKSRGLGDDLNSSSSIGSPGSGISPGQSMIGSPISAANTRSLLDSLASRRTTTAVAKPKPTPKAGKGAPHRCLTRSYLTKKLAREYMTLIGILSTTPYGLSYFDKFNLYEALYPLAKDTTKDYLTRALLANLDYCDKRARTLLETWVKSGSTQLRKFAVSQLRLLLRATGPDFVWAIGMLVSQLPHPDRDLRLAVLSVLEEACQDPTCLKILIKKKPSFAALGAAANNLQVTFLSTKAGVEYLQSVNWIEPQLKYWKSQGNQKYVEGLENALVAALSTNASTAEVDVTTTQTQPGAAQPGQHRSSDQSNTTPSTVTPWYTPIALRSEHDDYYFERIHQLPWSVEIILEYPHRNMQLMCEAFVHTCYRSYNETCIIQSSTSGSNSTTTQQPTNTTPTATPGTPSELDSAGGLVTYVVAILVDHDGSPKPYRIEPGVNIRTRLTVGIGSEGVDPAATDRSAASRLSRSASHFPFSSSSAAKTPSNAATTATSPTDRDRDWYKTYFTDAEQICRATTREQLSAERHTIITAIDDDIVRWNFDETGSRENSSNGTTSTDAGAVSMLESVWFQLPPASSAAPVVALAPHMYGELAKTREGMVILSKSGHVANFVSTIKGGDQLQPGISHISSIIPPPTSSPSSNFDDEDGEPEESPQDASLRGHTGSLYVSPAATRYQSPSAASSLEKRAALWAIGQIGSSPWGFEELEKSDIVQYISDQAKYCPTLSMRGTCFYILGLLSRTDRARSLLSRLGWHFCPHAAAGIVVPIPEALPVFLSIPKTPYAGSWAQDAQNVFGITTVPAKTDDATRTSTSSNPLDECSQGAVVLGHISNLCNHVTQKSSLQTLRQMRADHKHLFSSAVLLFETFKLLSSYTYRLPARRFILFDLFVSVSFNANTMTTFDGKFQSQPDQKQLIAALQAEMKYLMASTH